MAATEVFGLLHEKVVYYCMCIVLGEGSRCERQATALQARLPQFDRQCGGATGVLRSAPARLVEQVGHLVLL